MITLTDSFYPFEFVGVSKTGADKYQQDTLIYRFRSLKSSHEYEVHVERYVEHLCCIKFFDTSSTHGFGRFSRLSDTFEPRTIFRTVADIARDALNTSVRAELPERQTYIGLVFAVAGNPYIVVALDVGYHRKILVDEHLVYI